MKKYNGYVKVGDWIILKEHEPGKRRPVQVLPTETYFSLVRQMLSDNGQAYVRVTGMSMWPLLRHMQDGVVIVPPERIRKGDIVLFDRRSGRYALHRVICKGRQGFTMAGDNQWHMERNLPYDQIVGVVAGIHRNDRFIPCDKLSVKLYAWAVTLLAVPRIYLRQMIRLLLKPFRRDKTSRQEGRL